jgi:hypothetical protein
MVTERSGSPAIAIGVARIKLAALVAVLGAVAVIAAARALAGGDVVVLVLVLVVFGLPLVGLVHEAFRRGPVLVLDDDGLRDTRSGQAVRWGEVHSIYARRRQGAFNEFHELVLLPRAGDRPPIEVSIDRLALRWDRIVPLVEARTGRAVAVHRQRR